MAQDENVHPYTRQQALQQRIGLAKTPIGKPAKLDWESLIAPSEAQQGEGPAAQFTPPPTPPTELPGTGVQFPTQAAPATLAAQPGIFMTPEQQQKRAGEAAASQSKGALSGQIAARKEALQGIPLPPGQEAAYKLGMPISAYGAYGQGDTLPDPSSPTGWSRVIRDRMGNVIQTVPAQEPSAYAPSVTQGTQLVPQAGGDIAQVPTMTTTQKVPRGQAVPTPPGGPVGAKTVGHRDPVGEQGSYIPVLNEQGVIQYFYNPKSGQTKPVPANAPTPPADQPDARKTPLPPAENVRRATADTMLGMMDEMEQMVQGDKDAVGPFTGRVTEPLKQATIGSTPNRTELYRKSRDIADMLLRARSGAQISMQEYNRLTKLVPNPNQPYATFMSNLHGFRTEAKSIFEKSTGKQATGAGPRKAPPAVGTVVKGYRFKGGNPADRNAWEKVAQ